jgi:hypothetical protein
MNLGAFRRSCAALLLGPVLASSGCTARATGPMVPYQTHLRVCLRPPIVESDARQWAVDSETGTTVSGNDTDAFEAFLPYADVIYIFDFRAPPESAQLLPEKYARESCDDEDRILPRAQNDEMSLPNDDSNPLYVARDFGPHTEFAEISPPQKRFIGVDVQPKKRVVPVFRVCARPPGISSDVLQWAAVRSQTEMTYTTSNQQFALLAAEADRIFIFDANAPPESVREFGAPFDKLQCPGKPAPKPDAEEKALEKRKAHFEELVQQALAQKGDFHKAGLGGSPMPTWTSSETGQGKALSAFETIVRQTLIAQGILSGDTSGNLKDPNGARYGLPNGKNPNGFDSFFLQFVAATFSFLPTAVKSGTQFLKRVAQAAKDNAVLIIANPNFLPKRICKGLVKRFGDQMAPALQRMKTIMPYSRAEIFTAEWRHLYQSHHILEVDMARIMNITDADHLPAIILTDLEHKAITKRLNQVRNDILGKRSKESLTKAEIRQIYETAYESTPIWLEAIKSYF